MARKILIADDEDDLLKILSYNLRNEGYHVLTVKDGQAALEAAKEEPDLFILDVMMPKMDGLQVCKALRREHIKTPVIFLTAKDSEIDEVLGLEIGGDDYVTKPFSIRTMLARVKAHLRKTNREESGKVESVGALALDTENYTIKLHDQNINLTKTEFQLLAYLVQHPNVVHSRERLLSNVWGTDTIVIDRTVDVHIGKLRRKLGEYGEFIETKAGVGYRFNTQRISDGD